MMDFLRKWLEGIYYKRNAFFRGQGPVKIANFSRAATSFVLRRPGLNTWPPVVKIDITPLCNLKCPVCIHAAPSADTPILRRQRFHASQRMGLDLYRAIIDEVREKTLAVYLYLYGEPFMHPDVLDMARYARDAGLNVLVSTHLCFRFTDDTIAAIARSGITHLEVCIDGATQAVYERYRVGGRLDLALGNLRRLCEYKRAHSLAEPVIEVQMLQLDHNRHERETLSRLVRPLGVDLFTAEVADTGNWAELAPENFEVLGPRPRLPLPRCFWPFGAIVIRYDGAVIPCCLWGGGLQYTDGEQGRTLGDVRREGVLPIWNGTAYRDLRAYAADPSLVERRPELRESFCHGCPQVSRIALRRAAKVDLHRVAGLR
jgi:MoaA/NifB/PqqE/SkfB family radical SAM enzyme